MEALMVAGDLGADHAGREGVALRAPDLAQPTVRQPSRPPARRPTGSRGGRPKGGRSSADPAGVNGRRLGYGNAHDGSGRALRTAVGATLVCGKALTVQPDGWGLVDLGVRAMGRRQKHGAAAMGCAILLGLAAPVQAQSSGASIVDEALKGVQEDQARDAERVRRMVDEAVEGTEAAPSGLETSTRQRTGRSCIPLPRDAPGALPAGYRAEELVGKPVRGRHRRRARHASRPWCSTSPAACRAGDGRLHAAVRAAGQDIAPVAVDTLTSPSSRGDGFDCQPHPGAVGPDARLCAGRNRSGAGSTAEPATRSCRRRCDRPAASGAGASRCNCRRRREHQRPALELGGVLDARGARWRTAAPSAPASGRADRPVAVPSGPRCARSPPGPSAAGRHPRGHVRRIVAAGRSRRSHGCESRAGRAAARQVGRERGAGIGRS